MEPEQQAVRDAPPSATHLLAATEEISAEYRTREGVCCFCGTESEGQHVDDATSKKYFSDDPLLLNPGSEHVCKNCAWTMDQRTFKQGHWIVHNAGVESLSTGDLLDAFRSLRSGRFDPPLAVHITSSPIRSSHSYLWTPVNATDDAITIAYDRQMVRIDDWSPFSQFVAAIEDLRLNGFTFDEIRSGAPRVRNLREIGKGVYRDRDRIIDPYRRTARLELGLTLSRSADDQPRSELTDDHNPLMTNDT